MNSLNLCTVTRQILVLCIYRVHLDVSICKHLHDNMRKGLYLLVLISYALYHIQSTRHIST